MAEPYVFGLLRVQDDMGADDDGYDPHTPVAPAPQPNKPSYGSRPIHSQFKHIQRQRIPHSTDQQKPGSPPYGSQYASPVPPYPPQQQPPYPRQQQRGSGGGGGSQYWQDDSKRQQQTALDKKGNSGDAKVRLAQHALRVRFSQLASSLSGSAWLCRLWVGPYKRRG